MKKNLPIIPLLIIMLFSVSACDPYASDDQILNELMAWLENYDAENQDSEDASESAALVLKYPAGWSPNVFTSGWVFGAGCTIDGEDYSSSVKWGGSGSFSPDTGPISRPVFNSPGANTITLSVKVDDETYEKTFTVNAVSPVGYAHVGMLAKCDADGHGAPSDPLPVIGPITRGSPNVFVNGKPAARVGDMGIHAACTGPNTFEIISGDSSVLINGRPAAKIGSETRHCGGMGTIIGGG